MWSESLYLQRRPSNRPWYPCASPLKYHKTAVAAKPCKIQSGHQKQSCSARKIEESKVSSESLYLRRRPSKLPVGPLREPLPWRALSRFNRDITVHSRVLGARAGVPRAICAACVEDRAILTTHSFLQFFEPNNFAFHGRSGFCTVWPLERFCDFSEPQNRRSGQTVQNPERTSKAKLIGSKN